MGSSCSCRYSWDVIRCQLICAASKRQKKDKCRCVTRRPKFLRRRRKLDYKCTCSRRHCIVNKPRCQKPPICSQDSSPCCADEKSVSPNKSKNPSPCLLTKIPVLCSPKAKKDTKEPEACGVKKSPVCPKPSTSPNMPNKNPSSCTPKPTPRVQPLQRPRSDVSCGPDSPPLGPPCLRSRGQSPKGCDSEGSRSASPSPTRPGSNAGSMVPQPLCDTCGGGPKNVCRFTIDAYFT